jgi:glyoxylase-like metal-dependent hydrolase (beta-lactamase superfamily II)
VAAKRSPSSSSAEGGLLRPRELSASVEAFAARTPTLPPAAHTNSYAIGSREVVLVEPATPYEDEQRAWLAWARGLASKGRTLRAIFLTHHHVDHVGGAALLARELALPLWAHEVTAQRLPALKIDKLLDDAELLELEGPVPTRWLVLHTPGHAPGHLCLFEERTGALVLGDMVATEGTILIETTDGDMQAYLAQLERLAGLGARLGLPAHGAPIDDPAALLGKYVAHRRMREAKVLDAVRALGPAQAADLVPRAYDDTPASVWPLAKLATEAHLVKLVREGRVRRDADGRYLVSS